MTPLPLAGYEFEERLVEALRKAGTSATRATFAHAVNEYLGMYLSNAIDLEHRPESLARVADRLADAIASATAVRSDLVLALLFNDAPREWMETIDGGIRHLVELRDDVQLARSHSAVSVAKRGPKTAAADSLAFDLAWTYMSVLEQRPTHSNRKSDRSSQTSFDRVCDVINELTGTIGTRGLPLCRLSAGARKRAVDQVAALLERPRTKVV
jgi:hypothetical protein